jgi:hypothetical protein
MDSLPEEEVYTPEEGAEVEQQEQIETYLRDLTEDDVYNRLSQVNELPQHINALESRFQGNLSQYAQRLEGLEKSLSNRTSFDAEKLQKVLNDYDPQLAEALVPALQEALQTTPLDENTLRPHIEPVQRQMAEWMGEQLVLSAYPIETLSEIIPPVQDGKFAPQGQRHKDFIDWYSQQGYQTQQALLTFGAPYVNALRKFEAWERDKTSERTQTASNKAARLKSGQVPTSQSRRTQGSGSQTPQDVFLAAFQEASSELGR